MSFDVRALWIILAVLTRGLYTIAAVESLCPVVSRLGEIQGCQVRVLFTVGTRTRTGVRLSTSCFHRCCRTVRSLLFYARISVSAALW
jgi:hypothetical protein